MFSIQDVQTLCREGKIKWSLHVYPSLEKFESDLKTSEREKANYMTYQMKIAEVQSEARAEAKAEERKIGIKSLIATAKAFAATPAQAVEQLMKNYPLTEEEAKAAVHANW